MVSKFKSIALAGTLAFVAAPAFAQQGAPIVGDLPVINGLPLVGDNASGLDLDPFHIFTPAAAPAPAAEAPAPAVVHHHHHVHHVVHHVIVHHKKKAM